MSALRTVDSRCATIEDRDAALERPQGRRDLVLGCVVERRGRLVQHEDSGPAVERPSKPDPLTLAAGQPHAALADLGLEPGGQFGDDVIELGGPDHLGDAVRSIVGRGHAERDVGRERVVEQEHVLRHDAEPSEP